MSAKGKKIEDMDQALAVKKEFDDFLKTANKGSNWIPPTVGADLDKAIAEGRKTRLELDKLEEKLESLSGTSGKGSSSGSKGSSSGSIEAAGLSGNGAELNKKLAVLRAELHAYGEKFLKLWKSVNECKKKLEGDIQGALEKIAKSPMERGQKAGYEKLKNDEVKDLCSSVNDLHSLLKEKYRLLKKAERFSVKILSDGKAKIIDISDLEKMKQLGKELSKGVTKAVKATSRIAKG